jgi:hypothetical protein
MPSSCLYKIAHLATKMLPYKATVFRLVGRFHGSNHMPTKIGPSGCSCEMPVNEEAMMAADMIGFMESVV